MAQITIKKSSVANKVPLSTDLAYGELALNYQDGKLYYKKADNSIDSFLASTASIAGVSSFNTRTGAITLNSTDVTGALGFTPPSVSGSGATGTWGISITGTSTNVASGETTDLNAIWTTPGTSIANGFRVYRYNGGSTNAPPTVDNANWLINLYSHVSGGTASYGHQLAGQNDGSIYARNVSNGGFGAWNKLLHSANYNSYSPTLTGTGATGTWGINITGTATALQTARTITIGNTGKAFNGSANVTWSTGEIGAEAQQPQNVPRNNLGDPTVREMALFDGQFNNKIERYDIANVFVETSTDNVTWTPFAITDAQKRILVGGDTSQSTLAIPYGTAYFRIRMRANNYVFLNAFYAYWSGSGHSTTVKVFKKHDLDVGWTAVANSATTVSSWPGHLYLPHDSIPWRDNATQGTHVHEVYVVLQPTWNPSFPTNPISLYKVQWWGGYPAGRRNLYSTSELGDALFPAGIAAIGAITQNGSQVLHAGNYTSYALPLTGGTLTGTLSHNGLVPTDGTNIDQIKTITKSITMTTDWQDTGIKSTDLATGTYMIQLFANDTGSGGTNNNEYYSGTLSWYSGDTNSAMELPTDEITLHRAGGSGDGALYLRTFRTATANPDNLKLQVYSNTANASAANYVFKFRRII